MRIILDKNETEEIAYILLRDLADDPNKWDRLRKSLIWKTNISTDILNLMIETYIE